MRFLVHLHLYYHNQIDYFIEKLSNISDCDWDLFVTICEEDEISRQKILALKPDAKIIEVNNIGYDIWPFLQILKLVDLDQYDYVLKLHTKNYRKKVWWPKDYKYKSNKKGFYWRNTIVEPLVGSKKIFKENLKILSNNIGMIVDRSYMISLKQNSSSKDLESYENLVKKLNITNKYTHFFAGTMFIIKSSILKRLLNLSIDESYFDVISQQGITSSYAHALERVFATLVKDSGYEIYLRENKNLLLWFILFKIFSLFFLSIKDIKGRRIIKILGFKLSIKNKIKTTY